MRTDPLPSLTDVEVYDIASGMGGTFTVSIVADRGNGLVTVRIWFGRLDHGEWQSLGLFDGRVLTCWRDTLTNPRRLGHA